MSFYLKPRNEEEQAQVEQEFHQPKKDLSFGERFSAKVKDTRIRKDLRHQRSKHEQAYAEELKKRLPPQYEVAQPTTATSAYRRMDHLFSAIKSAGADDPNITQGMPTTIEEFDAEVTRRRRAELDEVNDTLRNSDGWSAELLGDMYAEVSTFEGAGMVLSGGLAGGGRLGLTMLTEGAISGIDEARTLPEQFEVAEDLDLPTPKPVEQVSIAAVTGAGVAGALVGAGKVVNYGLTRRNAAGARRPEGSSQLSFGKAVDDAQQSIERGEEVEVRELQTPPPIAADAPRNWEAIRNGIFAGESGGDYNALFGYQNRPGGRFSHVKLTEMTVDEAIAFSRGRNEYGQWVKSRIGRIATPMGAYQIVGTTLRAAKKGLRLTGAEKMTPELQDKLGIWIYKQQGTGAWEGYRGPRSSPVGPVDPNARAPGVAYGTRTPTSRDYTGSNSVVAGNSQRIDVEYQVVDAATLSRASGDLQPRDRGRAASDEQIAEIAAGLDPERLLPAPEADRGAPVVGPDNIIESGNGRVAAIERAYEQHPDRADAYKEAITASGFTIPEGIERPVLVARRTSQLSDAQRGEFVRAANTSGVARMSATERAAVDARNLDADTIAMFEPTEPLTSKANTPFAQRVLNSMPQAERNALVNGDGSLNAEGVQRIRQAMFARAYDAPDIIARYAEADAGQLRSLMEALETSAPEWAQMRSAVREGRVRAEMDVTDHLLEAMRLIADARYIAMRENKASASMVEELLNDHDLLEGAIAPLTAALVRKFYPNARPLPAAKVGDFLSRYAAEARKVGTTDASLFDDAVGVVDVLRGIDGDTFGSLTTVGKAKVPAARPEPIASDAMPPNAFADGASSPEIQEAADELQAKFSSENGATDADIQNAIDELGDDFEMLMEDGSKLSAREILRDLDQDDVLDTVISACSVKGAN